MMMATAMIAAPGAPKMALSAAVATRSSGAVGIWILHFRGREADVVPGVGRKKRAHLRYTVGDNQTKHSTGCGDSWNHCSQEISTRLDRYRSANGPEV